MAKEAKVKKEKKAKEPKASINDVLQAIVSMNNNLNVIAQAVQKPVETAPLPQGPVAAATPLPVTPVFTSPEPAKEMSWPVPPEFREAVDTILNKKFGIHIEYYAVNASFAFSVLVPKEYSDATPAYWAMNGEDRRTKVILNALGINGVTEWCRAIYNSFSPELKSKILYDRTVIG